MNRSNSRASFYGPHGVNARPTTGEMAAMHERHFGAAHNVAAHNQVARQVANRGTASFNHSRYTTANRNGRRFGAASNRQPNHVNGLHQTNEVAHSQPNRVNAMRHTNEVAIHNPIM